VANTFSIHQINISPSLLLYNNIRRGALNIRSNMQITYIIKVKLSLHLNIMP